MPVGSLRHFSEKIKHVFSPLNSLCPLVLCSYGRGRFINYLTHVSLLLFSFACEDDAFFVGFGFPLANAKPSLIDRVSCVFYGHSVQHSLRVSLCRRSISNRRWCWITNSHHFFQAGVKYSTSQIFLSTFVSAGKTVNFFSNQREVLNIESVLS